MGPSVSKKADLLTRPRFHGPAVSKNAESLTEPVIQTPAVREKPVLLTGQSIQAEAYPTHRYISTSYKTRKIADKNKTSSLM